jgi:hypothetical protein
MSSKLEIDNIVAASGLRLSNPTVPASGTDTGTQGDISWDSNYLYVCTSGDTWKRVGITSWTLSDPYFDSVSLLLQDSFTDESSHGQTIVVEGDTALSTSEVKVGSYSFAFDDTGDRLTISSDSAFAFGAGDYTVETWLFIPTHATTRQVRILSTTNTSSNFSFEVLSTGAVRVWTGANLLTFGGTAVTQGAWHHVAFCRASNVVRAFVDGSQIGSAISNTTNMVNNQNIQFPSTNSYAGPACYMDGIRVTKAARYVSAFSPPTSTFPTS